MARSNYSAGKRQREKERAKKKKEKLERARERSRSGGSGVPVATVDEIQGGMMSIDQVMRNMTDEGGDEENTNARATVPSRLFIGGLDWRVTDDELKKKLEEYGPITDVHIVKDRDTGDSRGFGFVTMASRKDADKAIKELDGQEFSGRNLVVRQATERGR